jgi:hypothetical protein
MPLAIGAVAAPVVGGIIGNSAAQADKDRAAAARAAALAAFQGISVPAAEQQAIQLQREQSAGTLTPQQEALYQQGPSAMNGVAVDPRLKTAQLQALSSLQNIGNSGGMNLQDQANMQNLIGQQNQNNRSQQDSIMQNMSMRGMGGSGMQLAAQLSAQKKGATNANAQGTNIAAQAQQRALQALQSAGTQAGQMSAQDFGQQSQVASANDIINRFNSQNQQSVSNANTQAQNSAQASNLQNAQNISNANTGLANQQQIQNKGLVQQNFNNQMAKAGGLAGQYNSTANADQAQAGQTAAMWSGIGSGVGQGFAAYGAKKAKTQDEE